RIVSLDRLMTPAVECVRNPESCPDDRQMDHRRVASQTISLIILTSRRFAFFGTQIGVRVVLLVTIVLAPNHSPFSNPWAFTHQGNDPFLRQLVSNSPRLNRFVV